MKKRNWFSGSVLVLVSMITKVIPTIDSNMSFIDRLKEMDLISISSLLSVCLGLFAAWLTFRVLDLKIRLRKFNDGVVNELYRNYLFRMACLKHVSGLTDRVKQEELNVT